jgi:glutamate synthase domain-containing protein 2
MLAEGCAWKNDYTDEVLAGLEAPFVLGTNHLARVREATTEVHKRSSSEEESDSFDLEDDLEVKDEVVNPCDDVKNQGYFEESSTEEEDEWEKQIMSKKQNSLDSRNCATPSKSSAKSPKSASSRKRRGKLKQEESSSNDEVFENVTKISRRLLLRDSEDDEQTKWRQDPR